MKKFTEVKTSLLHSENFKIYKLAYIPCTGNIKNPRMVFYVIHIVLFLVFHILTDK